ncbi:MAG: rRNA adenine N-6-methyltransferase family protein [Minisyncoccia bacterium]
MEKTLSFLKNALLGKRVGAISRSSRYVIEAVLENIGSEKYDKIVEYGPGDGVMTVELLKRLSPNGKLLAVEIEQSFIKDLERLQDKRLIIVNGGVEEVSRSLRKYGFTDADLVVSSIPFTFISKDHREEIIRNTKRNMKGNGKLIIFHQYSLLMLPILKKYFSLVEKRFEPRNFFPCFIFVARNRI